MFGTNNQYTGTQLGRDRMGFTTPDPDASEPLMPFLPVQYPAPWLPKKRRDDAHPAGANKVISIGQLIGLDKSGALIPAGLLSGSQPASAMGDYSGYCLLKYDADDVGFSFNPKTGTYVAAEGEYVLIGCPSNAAVAPTTVIDGVTITQDDIDWALTCDLIPGGTARAVGFAVKDMYQFLGGVKLVGDQDFGMAYRLDGTNPVNFKIHNYMHEAGQAVKTHFVLRMPWIGATPTTIATKLRDLSVTGYSQTDFSRSFVHAVGTKGNAAGNLFPGCLMVPAMAFGAKESGNYAPFNPTIHTIDNVVGKVLGIENMNPIRDYADRVRTQFERAGSFVGPFADKNPVTFLMGGSATRGMDTAISIGTNGAFRTALDQGKVPPEECSTYVLIHVRL